MTKKTWRSSQLKERLIKQLVRRLAMYVASAIITAAVIFAGGTFLFSLYTWKWENPIYQLAKRVEYLYPWLLIIIILIVSIVALVQTWLQSVEQLDEVLDASRTLYKNQEVPLHLSNELQEFEIELNQIKYEIDVNQRTAKEAEQRKNDLIVYLAHDLKTPLTSVIGYLTLLRDEQEMFSPELRKKYLHISLEKAERLEELINEFFEIARFNLSNIELSPTKVNLTMMFEQLSYEFLPVLSAKNLTLTREIEGNTFASIDVDKMQRVFDNLLQNAVNYSYEGEEIVVRVKSDEAKKQLLLSFTNHGPIIPPEKLTRIFEQFFRLDTSRQTNRGGAGLGLAITKQIVELHGGQLKAESHNEMTTLTIYLPFS
ncbi:two-component system, OmpR family, sensor histidine kinase VanS [Enterococcus sp. AZ194]|uniref:sensor histidine kinase n=1 Tax=Enterococcus sp. AZ194 TaxID=2774629 RepID=UPI003F29AF71